MKKPARWFKAKRLMFIWTSRICLFLAFINIAQAQNGAKAVKNRSKGEFHALARAGLTTSQVYGDGFGGYNKLGFTAGVGTYTAISNRFDFQFELNYSTRGARKRPTSQDPTIYRIGANYIDIPLLLKTSISFFELEFGICNGVYLFHNEADNFGRVPKNLHGWQFNRYELAGNVGINVPINEKWLVNARFHYSLLPAAGKLGFVSGFALFGGAYNNVITLSLHRRFRPSN